MEASEVIKRAGRRPSEAYAPTKLHASVLAACLSVRTPEGEAEMIAHEVTRRIAQWLGTKPEVTSSDLRRKASEYLESLHPEASYLYKHHEVVL